jgi:hypothetical protein
MEIIGKIFLVIWKIIKWLFATSWFLTVVFFALIDLWLGDGSWWRSLTAKNTGRGRDTENEIITKIQKEIPQATNEEVLEKYGELEPTTSIEFQIIQKLKKSPQKSLNEVLSEEEMQTFIIMLLRKLGII